MHKILHYLGEMLVVAVPAAIVFSCFWPYRRSALEAMGLRTNPLREVTLIAFIMCLFGVLAVTLWPVYLVRNQGGMWGDVLLLIERPSPLTNVNLVPFRMFQDYWQDLTQGGGLFTVINFLGNLAVFVPLGLFPALLWEKRGSGRCWWEAASPCLWKSGSILLCALQISTTCFSIPWGRCAVGGFICSCAGSRRSLLRNSNV